MMERTQSRTLPAGLMQARTGLVIALFFLLSGLGVLWIGFGVWPPVLGLVTVFLYNGLYTYLKRVTAFAAIPGALVGALPPAIGWTAAGGEIGSPTLAGLVLFFYLWQVPHFWLLVGRYHREYNQAGFPALTDRFSQRQLARLTFTWTAATACAALFFLHLRMLSHKITPFLLVVLVVWLAIRSVALVSGKTGEGDPVFRRAFFNINIFALLIMVMLIIDNGI